MALPLNGPDVPCGHVTLVNAMHLGKAFAITKSSGVVDYVRDGENAIMCSPGSADEMAGAIERLWQDTDLRLQMGEEGRVFASEYCTEKRIIGNFQRLLVELGVVSKKADFAHV
jgi:glycosyltransferase involved in cell wall biosynthesis